ncbi:hypothetical protein F511_08914 [Dorcoceras hygrometricum]|uniref:Uncharacterized protein n=1 Tax=Dorcoceras hygrometricum TaxID=472368 RepID=A0A2Z7B2V4_9LAMI|nr:hypothetical protein F511_08914 [Dorcoceras hygrometricum]
MGACASRFKVLNNSGDAPPPPVTKEEAAAPVTEREVDKRDEGLVAVEDDEAKHQSLGQMLIQENEGDEGLVKNGIKASGELEQEDEEPQKNETLKSLEAAEEAEKTEEKPVQISNLEAFEKFEDKHVAEPVKAVEFEGNEESETAQKPEAKKIDNE